MITQTETALPGRCPHCGDWTWERLWGSLVRCLECGTRYHYHRGCERRMQHNK